MDNEFEDFEKFASSKHPKEYSIYQIRSIRNFIHHYNELSLEEKMIVKNKIGAYLTDVKEKDYLDKNEKVDYYYKYIYPIGKIYQVECGFTVYVDITTLIIWLLAINITLYILAGLSLILLYFILNGFILFYFFQSILKIRQKRVFSINY